MHVFAYLLLISAFLASLVFSALSAGQIFSGNTKESGLLWVERINAFVALLITGSSLFLLRALTSSDFSLKYVASYTNLVLPIFYKLTAFWAGHAGSLLFWVWCISISAVIFTFGRGYQRLSPYTKFWFWAFFFSLMAFFLLLLTTWSNPFIVYSPAPADGGGLNPLLQNPGMIIHPPLLFMGYAGFSIPACLALAQHLNPRASEEEHWAHVCRPFILISWGLLSAGIILGAWWAYMELGWGGYWAWDPVENASLIPWLVATAYLHTSVIETRRNKLHRTNVFLMALTTISAIFATYLVRSGVVESLHAFPDGGVGTMLLTFILCCVFVATVVTFLAPRQSEEALSGPDSREGMLLFVAWVLLALAFIIMAATLWPVITTYARQFVAYFSPETAKNWIINKQGLSPDFYNKVCLPLFGLFSLFLIICPWLSWKGGLRKKAYLMVAVGILGLSAVGLVLSGYAIPLSVVVIAATIAAIASIFFVFVDNKALLKVPQTLMAHGVHLGLLLMVLGVAFSGAYKEEVRAELVRGGSATLGAYTYVLEEIYEGQNSEYRFIEAKVQVYKGDEFMGLLEPQRRVYHSYPDMPHSEVATIFSLGKEQYASLLGLGEGTSAVILFSSHPLVNWIWLGGIILSILPFFGLRRATRADD